jgi:hypothetical protein
MNPMRKALLGGTVVASTLVGGAMGAALLGGTANAADTTTTTAPAAAATAPSTAAPDAARPAHDPSQGGHQANGKSETLLTGDDATKATDAALAALPGATIERVETDADGATYEAHVVKADGTHATVLFDENFKVTSIETGR